ncbi:agmatinase [Anoxybacter fermentans]|uniref:Agmatinase n=1 Tax=Anoxybacter fermentans TaxID=1323375 RepID=A0A3Q9HR23_9FIRM|nr:agmatinase [Anoxybacter fermentans]
MTGTLRFLGSLENPEEANIIIVGAPMDFTVSYRPGSRFGPEGIRNISYGLEEFSFELEKSLEEVKFYDAGDLELPYGNVEKSLELIEKAAEIIVSAGKKPIFLGGEHLITWPVIKAVYRYYPDLVIIHFDAHADLREEFYGEPLSHATVMGCVARYIGGKNLYQLGIRSGAPEELAWARKNTHLYRAKVIEAIPEVIKSVGNRPVYVSIDIDVLDPAFAPGTGTPEPGGISSRELFNTLYMMKDLNLVGLDIVEVAPDYDPGKTTVFVAGKLLREALLIMDK